MRLLHLLLILSILPLCAAYGLTFTTARTCTNSTALINTCAATEALGGLNMTCTDAVGTPFNCTVATTNQTLSLATSLNLTIYGGYFETTPPHEVSINVWNGSSFVEFANLTKNAFNWTNISLSPQTYVRANTLNVSFLHASNGNPLDTGMQIDYVAITAEIRPNISAALLYPSSGTYGIWVNNCTQNATLQTNLTANITPGTATCSLFEAQDSLTSNYTLKETKAVGLNGSISFSIPANTSITKYRLNCTVFADGYNSSTSTADLELIGSSFCAGGSDDTSPGTAFLALVILGGAFIYIGVEGGDDV